MEKSAASVPTKHILAAGYIIHLILIAVFTTCILAKHSDLIAASATGIMLFLYGYMGVWLLLISFLLIIFKKYEAAVVLNRIIVKTLILLFPLFAILSISKEGQSIDQQVKVFILYMGIIAILLIIYELAICLCYQQKYPDFIFQQNDLTQAKAQILQKRSQYNQYIS